MRKLKRITGLRFSTTMCAILLSFVMFSCSSDDELFSSEAELAESQSEMLFIDSTGTSEPITEIKVDSTRLAEYLNMKRQRKNVSAFSARAC